jgi:hypothetical protein
MLLSSMKTAETQVRSLDVQCPHCRVTMRLMRHINLTGMPGIYVFYTANDASTSKR